MSPHTALKAATRAAHDRVDSAFAGFDLSDEAQYRRFLELHAAAFLPAEQALDEAGAAGLIEGWDDNSRSAALLGDLAELGVTVPALLDPPPYEGEAAILGGAYVLEGSRLGGAVLRRSVGPGLPRRFLDSLHPPGRWRAFVAQLNAALYEPQSLARATQAALGTFALFETRDDFQRT